LVREQPDLQHRGPAWASRVGAKTAKAMTEKTNVTPGPGYVSKKDLYFINNTIVNNGRPGSPWGGGMYFETDLAENVVVKNNISAATPGRPSCRGRQAPTECHHHEQPAVG
jgi:hypothetical protein